MDLRDYQNSAVDLTFDTWGPYRKVLGTAPTGSGKTVIFSEIARRIVEELNGWVLILAHREELIDQAIDKIYRTVGIFADKEKAQFRAELSSRVVVGSVQTLRSDRKNRFKPDHFTHIIVDECHHVLADSYQNVLNYFSSAKVLGVTATADRADKKNLANFFEFTAFEIFLQDLINKGYLVPLTSIRVPLQVDLNNVSVKAGDFVASELDNVIAPVLSAAVAAIAEYASDRKTVVFLPLVQTCKEFARIANEAGISANYVSGECPDRKEKLQAFTRGEFKVLANSMLLTEGWDEPSVDCILCLRPTKSRSLYAQIIGRGTRLHPGKENLLILDPLWLSEKHSLIKPVHLFANSEEQAKKMDKIFEASGGNQLDLMDLQKLAEKEKENEVREAHERELSLKRNLSKYAKRNTSLIDPIEFALNLHDQSLIDFEPTMPWEVKIPTIAQKEALEKAGVDVSQILTSGHASKLLDTISTRRKLKLATFKQIKWLLHFKHPSPHTTSFDDASDFLSSKFGKR